jgi:hypothetical protein
MGTFIALIIYAAMGLSWCVNAVKLVDCDFEAPYREEVVRSLAVPVAPLSWVVAWVEFDNNKGRR